jgi:hypothetical protein
MSSGVASAVEFSSDPNKGFRIMQNSSKDSGSMQKTFKRVLASNKCFRIRIEIKSWNRICIETNADPQHWTFLLDDQDQGPEELNFEKSGSCFQNPLGLYNGLMYVQVLQPQLKLRAWRDWGRQGGGGGLRPAGHPPEDHAAQLPGLPRQDPEGGLPRDSRQRGRSPGEGCGSP